MLLFGRMGDPTAVRYRLLTVVIWSTESRNIYRLLLGRVRLPLILQRQQRCFLLMLCLRCPPACCSSLIASGEGGSDSLPSQRSEHQLWSLLVLQRLHLAMPPTVVVVVEPDAALQT